MIFKINKELLRYFKEPENLNLLNNDVWLVQELTGTYSLWCKDGEHFIRQYEILNEPLNEVINNFFFMIRKIDIIDLTRGESLELEVIK